MFDDILVVSSTSLPEKLANDLEPWDLPSLTAYNDKFLSGFITESYGNPEKGFLALQIEASRALYMDERRYQRSTTFDRLAADLETLARRLGEIPLEQLRPYRAAAE